MTYNWEMDATHPAEYHSVEVQRGREFILRMTTGADVFLACQAFAQDHDIRFAKIHAAFMGGLQPARFLVWTPDTAQPDNWHNETAMEIQNLSMVLSMSGIIHPRPVKGGGEEPFPAIHFVTGGAWNVPTIGGHLLDGSIVKGVIEFFITEIKGIDVLYPEGEMIDPHAEAFPENWYKEI
ncbi:MAG TPA: DNA-binding protein [Chloroflexi bacterium]|nr:DNA-binding protein [Chloroflexota bacterium]